MKSSIVVLCLAFTSNVLSIQTAKAEEILSWKKVANSVEIEMAEGKLVLTPMVRNAIRVQYKQSDVVTLPEYVFLEQTGGIPYQVNETEKVLEVATSDLRACIDKQKGNIIY